MSNIFDKIIPDPSRLLFVDIGNSRIKMARRLDSGWNIAPAFEHDEISSARNWMEKQEGWDAIVGSSVVKSGAGILSDLTGDANSRLVRTVDLPARLLDYETPETLGIDRFLACYGAQASSGRPVVVIDAGTACTVDLMDENGVYHGGVIMAGLRLMERALEQHAPALPTVERNLPDEWPGKSTQKSLKWGLTGVFRDAVDAAVRRYLVHWPMAEIWITGGDADLLKQLLPWEANVSSTLVFDGLLRWVEELMEDTVR